jgi:hypothetical protein
MMFDMNACAQMSVGFLPYLQGYLMLFQLLLLSPAISSAYRLRSLMSMWAQRRTLQGTVDAEN